MTAHRKTVDDSLLEKVRTTVRRHGLLSRGQTVAVAVSGGPDSVALLSVLSELASQRRCAPAVLHVNHGLRGRESGQDARFVRNLAARYGLEYYGAKIRIAKPRKDKLSVNEELLRRKRYEALDRLAGEAGALVVALGHHRDDLAETVLMHFLRGSGPAGLGGFRPRTRMGRLTLVRPLYDCTREEILAYLRRRDLRWREDRTNRDTRWLRNRIRRELLPMLEREYNPCLRELLADNARRFQEDDAFFESRARDLLEKKKSGRRPPKSMPLEALAPLDPPILTRLLRLWIMAVAGRTNPPSGRQIDELVALVQRPGSRGEVRCSGDVVFFVEAGMLTWQRVTGRRESATRGVVERATAGREKEKPPPAMTLPSDGQALPRTGRCAVPSTDGGSVLRVEVRCHNRRRQPRAFRNAMEHARNDTVPTALEQYFDADKIDGDLTIRNRRTPDRFHPLGARGAKKLKDFLIDAKTPASLRPRLVLVCDCRQILWVAGVRIGHRARLTGDTKNILHIRMNARAK